MKQFSLILLLLLAISNLFSSRIMEFKGGLLAPEGADTGAYFGMAWGTRFDQIFEYNTSVDFYYKNISEQRKISYQSSTGGNQIVEIKKNTDISTYYLPLQFNGRITFPTYTVIRPFIGAGIGWGLLWEDAYVAPNNTYDKVSDVKFYSGFNWNVSGGVRFPLTSFTHIIGEITYNNGHMKRDYHETDTGITWDEIDMSGMGFRVGLQVRGF